MNENYSSIEPGTDLGLGLGFSDHHYYQGRLAVKSGVGANAGSMESVKYAATDSLSELVWSPHRGLSLRCADSTFNDRKNCMLCNASSLLQQNTTTEKPTSNTLHEDELIIPPEPEIHLKNVPERLNHLNRTVSGNANPASSDGKMPALEKGIGSKAKEIDSMVGEQREDPRESRVDEVPAIRQNSSSSSPVHTSKLNEVSKKRNDPELEELRCGLLIADPADEGRCEEHGNLTAGKDILHPTTLEQSESSVENGLEIMNEETGGGGEGSKIVATESANGVRGSNQQVERNICNYTADSTSLANSSFHWKQRKGKEKALSDGDVHARMPNNGDNSCASVESCSGAVFAKRKRRWSFEQQMIVGSKRVKQEDNASSLASNSGQDSSFRSWISNMIKGLSQSIQNVAPSLDLTLAKPEFKKKNDSKSKSFGFQSMFQSLYGPRQEGGISANYQMKRAAKAIDSVNPKCDLNATPISCYRETDRITPLIQSKNSPEFSCGSRHSRKTGSREKGNSCSLVLGSKKGEVTPNDVSKSKSIENVDCDLPSLKTNFNFGNIDRPDPLKSLWIARFAPKTSGLALNPESCNQNTKDVVDLHHSMEDLDTAASKEQCHTTNTDSSHGHKEFRSQNEQKSIIKFNSVLSPPRFRSSEAMASVFARRLGAFKHIIPADATETAGCETAICFFCGKSGHHLKNCSEITGQDIEGLSRNLGLCNEADGLLCFCVRCRQLDHWAMACPNASARGYQQPDYRVASTDDHDSGELQLNTKPRLVDTSDPNSKTDVKLDEKVSEEVEFAAASLPKRVGSELSEKYLKEDCDVVNTDSLPQLVFNAVKKLQLTRNDILKCMKSHVALSRLDGFFLRIRLGKWQGRGGTRYHVACVRGAQLAKNSLFVEVQGIECQVQSQYISNHGLLEDELIAWWCATSKDGGKKASLVADLRARVKKKKQMGL